MRYVDGIMTIMTFMSHHYIPVVNPQVFVHTPGYIRCCHATHHHSSVRDNPDLGISLYGNTRLRDERCDVNELLWYRPVMCWSRDLQPAQGAVGMQHLWQPLLTPPSLLNFIFLQHLTTASVLLDSPIGEILKCECKDLVSRLLLDPACKMTKVLGWTIQLKCQQAI